MDERHNPCILPSCEDFPSSRFSAWGVKCMRPPFLSSPTAVGPFTFSPSPPRRDNQAYVKATRSFDSHQLIIDPIKPKSAIVPPLKVSQICLCGEEKLCSLSCQSLVTFLPMLPWPGVRGHENREHELTRRECWNIKGGPFFLTALLAVQHRG